MSPIIKNVNSVLMPAIFIAWVTCGVVLICQYKGILPWFDEWIELAIIIVALVPPLLLILYGVVEVIRNLRL